MDHHAGLSFLVRERHWGTPVCFFGREVTLVFPVRAQSATPCLSVNIYIYIYLSLFLPLPRSVFCFSLRVFVLLVFLLLFFVGASTLCRRAFTLIVQVPSAKAASLLRPSEVSSAFSPSTPPGHDLATLRVEPGRVGSRWGC